MQSSPQLEATDLQNLKRIAQYRGLSEQAALSEVLAQALEDLEFDQAVDDALRSPKVRSAFQKLGETCERLGI